MVRKHLAIPPVSQEDDVNGCWAALLKRWPKAAWNRDFQFPETLMMFEPWTHKGEDENFGALPEKGLFKLFNDPGWHLMYKTVTNDKLNASETNTLLERSLSFQVFRTAGQQLSTIKSITAAGEPRRSSLQGKIRSPGSGLTFRFGHTGQHDLLPVDMREYLFA